MVKYNVQSLTKKLETPKFSIQTKQHFVYDALCQENYTIVSVFLPN